MKKLYIINTYHGISGMMEAEYATSVYAEMKEGKMVFSEDEIEDKENAEIEYVDGLELYHSKDIEAMRQKIIHRKSAMNLENSIKKSKELDSEIDELEKGKEKE